MSDDGYLSLGGTRATGLEVAKLLRGRGNPVTAVVREGSVREDLDAIGATVVTGDAMDRASLDAALEGKKFRAVISSLGGPPRDDRKVDLEGIGLVSRQRNESDLGVSDLGHAVSSEDATRALAEVPRELDAEAGLP